MKRWLNGLLTVCTVRTRTAVLASLAGLVLTSGCAAWFRMPSERLETVTGPQRVVERAPAVLGQDVPATITVIHTWDGATLDVTSSVNPGDLRTRVAKLAHDIRYGQRLGILIGPELLEARVRVDAIENGVRLRITTDDPDLAPILQQRVQELSRHLFDNP
jgi:hypothetical protein